MKAVARVGLGCYSHLFFLAFWTTIIFGYSYYGYYGDGDWTCYAT